MENNTFSLNNFNEQDFFADERFDDVAAEAAAKVSASASLYPAELVANNQFLGLTENHQVVDVMTLIAEGRN
jgi:hypothetical protein